MINKNDYSDITQNLREISEEASQKILVGSTFSKVQKLAKLSKCGLNLVEIMSFLECLSLKST